MVESPWMKPNDVKIMNGEDILIRLLKDGNITADEFKFMYELINRNKHPHAILKPSYGFASTDNFIFNPNKDVIDHK